MKLYAPIYYLEFKCIADKCLHSCCKSWEIDIDPTAMKKYGKLKDGYGKAILRSIEKCDCPHFVLTPSGNCPHLDEQGLCKIIQNLGQDYLCDICREHPRFYNETSLGKEVGLGISCEEACRIILSSDRYHEMISLHGASAVIDKVTHRSELYSVLSDRSLPYPKRLKRIYEKYGVCPSQNNDTSWRELLASLEYLDNDHKKIFSLYTSSIENEAKYEMILERVLAYRIYRHCSSAESDGELKQSLGFCLFCERLLSSAARTSDLDLFELARIFSEEIEYSSDNTEAIKLEFLF